MHQYLRAVGEPSWDSVSKWELEDYCFRYLHPTEYKRIAKTCRMMPSSNTRSKSLSAICALISQGVKAEVMPPKYIYSIWRKMQKKNLAFDELFDARVMIIAERLQDCYAALGIVHTHYRATCRMSLTIMSGKPETKRLSVYSYRGSGARWQNR